MKQSEIEHLISLTFDSDPEVRKKAALELAKYDDPGVILALLELAGDKNKEVAETARKILNEKKEKDPQIKPLTELFEGVNFSGIEEEEKISSDESRKKILEPIEKAFVKALGKEKAKKLMPKLMPKLFKAYSSHEKKFQTAITQYLETIGEETEEPSIEIEEVGTGEKVDIAKEAMLVEVDDLFTIEEKKLIEETNPSFFRMLYDVMLLSGGDERALNAQAKKLKKFLESQINLALKLAKKKFKEVKLTDISKIKNGMKNITTGPLFVVDVSHREYPKTKTKKAVYTRVVVRDEEGKEGVIYLFDNRGKFIKPGMRIKVERGKAKTFKFSGETAITVDKRGKVIAIF